MQIGAANAAGADFYQCRLLRNFRPWHGANDRLRTGTVIGANTNLFHEGSSGRSRLLIFSAWAEEAYVNCAIMPISALSQQMSAAIDRFGARSQLAPTTCRE
jgi:hypothetical protein